ncbi:hypothetical protein EVAR_42529_1 [Eumeta japonica]|uniref:Uncharacterized protein n=1 Tax=Eumeta variegata TaxID=151549 RepID=A0A4C1WRB0_EUMVA|nr:hypothetical protein EVAR_42529_1 [Eumeta japonica]
MNTDDRVEDSATTVVFMASGAVARSWGVAEAYLARVAERPPSLTALSFVARADVSRERIGVRLLRAA